MLFTRKKMIHDSQLCFNLSLRLVPSKGQPVWPWGGRRLGSNERRHLSVASGQKREWWVDTDAAGINSHRDPRVLFIKCINRCPPPTAFKSHRQVVFAAKTKKLNQWENPIYFLYLEQKHGQPLCVSKMGKESKFLLEICFLAVFSNSLDTISLKVFIYQLYPPNSVWPTKSSGFGVREQKPHKKNLSFINERHPLLSNSNTVNVNKWILQPT